MAVTGTSQMRAPRAKAKAKGKEPTRFEQVSAWLTLAANLGVLGGIVLVLLQLNQNEHMIRAQTRHEIAMGIVELLSDTATDPQLTEVLVRSNAGGDLTPAEQAQVVFRMGALVRLWEDEHYQYRMGLFDEAEFARERNNWKLVLATNPNVVAYWCGSRENFSADFADEVDGLLPPRACETAVQ